MSCLKKLKKTDNLTLSVLRILVQSWQEGLGELGIFWEKEPCRG